MKKWNGKNINTGAKHTSALETPPYIDGVIWKRAKVGGITCDDCEVSENENSSVSERICPFDLEINNREIKCVLCDDCYLAREEDI